MIHASFRSVSAGYQGTEGNSRSIFPYIGGSVFRCRHFRYDNQNLSKSCPDRVGASAANKSNTDDSMAVYKVPLRDAVHFGTPLVSQVEKGDPSSSSSSYLRIYYQVYTPSTALMYTLYDRMKFDDACLFHFNIVGGNVIMIACIIIVSSGEHCMHTHTNHEEHRGCHKRQSSMLPYRCRTAAVFAGSVYRGCVVAFEIPRKC